MNQNQEMSSKVDSHSEASETESMSHLRIVHEAFSKWSAGTGSILDLMPADGVVVIPGTVPHCGTFSKSQFVTEVATPFLARFSKPPLPRLRKIWADGGNVAVLADAEGTTQDGRPYANRYVFILELRDGRLMKATEFLDMAAFNVVWDGIELASYPMKTAEEDR